MKKDFNSQIEWYILSGIAEDILEFNGRNQKGKGLKILTPNQMLSR